MSEETTPFSCPHCKTIQPMSSAWMLTRFSELECKACQKPIKPLEKTVPRINAISGILSGILGFPLYMYIGYWAFIPVILFVCLANCFIVSRSVEFIKR